MKYDVAYGESTGDLAELVDSLMLDGWRPQGGIAVVISYCEGLKGSRTDWCYYQAMVKDGDDRPAAKPAPSEEV